MKKSIWILVTVLLLAAALAGCAPAASSPAPTASPSGPEGGLPATPSPSGSEAPGSPNVWVVTGEAPVTDEQGATVGTAYPGFAVNLLNEKDGKAVFTFSEMDDKGQTVKGEKTFSIDTKYMEKKYLEPQAVILIISTDMIKLNPGGALYNDAGEKLITFNDGLGPFFFIQKTDAGYMFTLDFNVVYAPEKDVAFIKLS